MRYFFLAVAFLIAAGCVVFFVLRNFSRPEAVQNQPKEWNTNAIRSSFAGVQIKEIDPTHAQLVFSYDLQNATASDYRLASGPDVMIMAQLKSDGSLRTPDSIRLDSSVLLPANSQARVGLLTTRLFNWPAQMATGEVGPFTQEKFRSLVANEVSNVQAFILFDQTARYKIELPGGWQEAAVSTPALN